MRGCIFGNISEVVQLGIAFLCDCATESEENFFAGKKLFRFPKIFLRIRKKTYPHLDA